MESQNEVGSSEVTSSSIGEPQISLKDNINTSETIENRVPLYVTINKESLNFVQENGFRREDNQMAGRHPKLENIFSEVGKEMGLNIDRTKCVFASPRKPNAVPLGLGFNSNKDVLVQIMVDPQNCLVANGENYTEASRCLSDFNSEDQARAWAKSYWEEAKPLKVYLQEKHTGKTEDWDDFTFPEVLIPNDIPVNQIQILEDYK